MLWQGLKQLRFDERLPASRFRFARPGAVLAVALISCVVYFSFFSRLLNHVENDVLIIDTETQHGWETPSITGPAFDAFSSARKHGRVLVTGAGGTIGKEITRALLARNVPVTAFDLTFKEDEVPYLHSAIPPIHAGADYVRHGGPQSLELVHEDIRNATALEHALTPDVVGVIHLAAVSRVLWCLNNAVACEDVNVRGTQTVLRALHNANNRDGGMSRWLLFASSREVYGHAPSSDPDGFVTEDWETAPANLYGETKLKGEDILRADLQETDSIKKLSALKRRARAQKGRLDVIALRLANVYGSAYDHVERIIPALVTNALAHQTIQIVGGSQKLDFVHVNDCVRAFLLARERLESLRNRWRLTSWLASVFSSPRGTFRVFNVASGTLTSVREIVDEVFRLTRSQSPIQYLETDARFPDLYRGSTTKAAEQLGFRARVPFKRGILELVRTYLSRTDQFLSTEIGERCEKGPVKKVDLQQLNDCKVHIGVNVYGQFRVFARASAEEYGRVPGVEEDEETEWRAVSDAGAQWYVSRKLPPNQLHVKVHAVNEGYDDLQKRHFVRIFDDKEERGLGIDLASYLALQREQLHGDGSNSSRTSHSVQLLATTPEQAMEFQLEYNREESALRLVVPDTNLQLVPSPKGNWEMHLTAVDGVPGEQKRQTMWPFKIQPHCCPIPGPWPFMDADPINFMTEYQRKEISRPFRSSTAQGLCRRLRQAHGKVQRHLSDLPAVPSNPNATLAAYVAFSSPTTLARTMSDHPLDWSLGGRPFCSNMCDHPTICVDTGDCQCLVSSCPSKRPFPFESGRSTAHFEEAEDEDRQGDSDTFDLSSTLARRDWHTVLRPNAWRMYNLMDNFTTIHVVPRAAKLQSLFEADAVHRLQHHHCFSADTSMERGLRLFNDQNGINAGNGQMAFLPFYQARGASNKDDIHDEYNSAETSVPGFTPRGVVIPFTHDWGQCIDFDWNLWYFRMTLPTKPSPVVAASTAWTVMADLNSPCYKPAQDVPIPPRTCVSPELYARFTVVRNVKPAQERAVLAAFKGTLWGTGLVQRARLQCTERKSKLLDAQTLSKHPLTTAWDDYGSHADYLDLLGDTIFCPQAAGTTGWATRLVDSIYAGCIPVLFGHASEFPFWRVIDWGKISVRLEVEHQDRVEDVLLTRYSSEDIRELQINLMLVRDAFVYPLDDVPDEEFMDQMLHQRGPLFYALLQTTLLRKTVYPMSPML